MHAPIKIKQIALRFLHKILFEDFSTIIYPGQKIAIIGRNGSGKSCLLKVLAQQIMPDDGLINLPKDASIGYIAQIIEDHNQLSGGQRFLRALTETLAKQPDILLLDEPTNHLDAHNHKMLLRTLANFKQTLIVVSHDPKLLAQEFDQIWQLEHGKISIFNGSYESFKNLHKARRENIETQISRLKQESSKQHQKLMQQQEKTSKRKAYGAKKFDNDKISLRNAQATGQKTANKTLATLNQQKQLLTDQLADLRLPEEIKPSFTLNAEELKNRLIINISSGDAGYGQQQVLKNLSLQLIGNERLAITGPNGSGKTTLFKAILQDKTVSTSGSWYLPKPSEIGHLEQHYQSLNHTKTVLETIAELMPGRSHNELRQLLNQFLFRKNEEVGALTSTLSGGEKVRLCLAQLAAKTPKLLLLDEVTNNLDLETRQHVIEVLRQFSGAMLVISHDEDFLKAINIENKFEMDKI